jgi:hypothetical protein
MSKTTKKKQTQIPDRETAALVDRKPWPIRIEPGEPKVLGKHLPAGVLVMHNRGPGEIRVNTAYTNVEAILAPGDTDLIIVRDHFGFASIDGKPAVLEFEFLLVLK